MSHRYEAIYPIPSEEHRRSVVGPIVSRKLALYDRLRREQPEEFGNVDLDAMLEGGLRATLEHFEDHGWVRARGIYPQSMCQATVLEMNRLFRAHGFDVFSPSTWKSFPFKSAFVELYHLDGLYRMRWHRPMVLLFCVLYETTEVRVMIDRISAKRGHVVPTDDIQYRRYLEGNLDKKEKLRVQESGWHSSGFWHHDMNLLTGETPMSVQCVVALDDTEFGWQGFDRFHWVAEQWAHSDSKYCNRMSKPSVSIPVLMPHPERWEHLHVRPSMKRGDVIAWKSQLAHGSAPNLNPDGRLRLAAYINYTSIEEDDPSIRADMIRCFKGGWHPNRIANGMDKWERIEHQIVADKRKDGKLIQPSPFELNLMGM